jgi:hypothetical protein
MVDADRRRLVPRITTAHRSCLVRSEGQPSATMVRKQRGGLEKSSPFEVHQSFSMDSVRVGGAVEFDGAVNGGEVDEKLFPNTPSEKR